MGTQKRSGSSSVQYIITWVGGLWAFMDELLLRKNRLTHSC